MASAALALQKGIFQALASDAALLALLGGVHIHDGVPQAAMFPFISIDPSQTRDWSTGTERGEEHLVTLHIWSRYAGRKELYEIADAIRAVLDEAALPLAGQTLINLRHQYSDLSREEDGETYHAALRFRAVTEPAA